MHVSATDSPLLLELVRPQRGTVNRCATQGSSCSAMGNAFGDKSSLRLWPISTVGPKCASGTFPGFAQLRDFVKNPKRLPNLLSHQLKLLFGIMTDSQVPWTAKLAASLSVGYVFSPIQLIPSFIPIIGQMDDIAVIWLGMKMVRKYAGEQIVAKHLAILQARSADHSSTHQEKIKRNRGNCCPQTVSVTAGHGVDRHYSQKRIELLRQT
jgi:uncharacterized membrane protein YkvA (DUF1232 family)